MKAGILENMPDYRYKMNAQTRTHGITAQGIRHSIMKRSGGRVAERTVHITYKAEPLCTMINTAVNQLSCDGSSPV